MHGIVVGRGDRVDVQCFAASQVGRLIVAELKIQFLAFDGCPLADAAKRALDDAMASLNLSSYEVVDILGPNTPDNLRGWGSPTILINGKDVAGHDQGDGVGCRVYPGPSKVPDARTIIDCIEREAAS